MAWWKGFCHAIGKNAADDDAYVKSVESSN